MKKFTNNNFYGEINGKTIRDFAIEKHAYQKQRSDERVEYIHTKLNTEKIGDVEFYDKYFDDLFTQTTDIPLDKDGIYLIETEDGEKYVSYDEYIAWCKETDNDPVEYAEITTPFDEIYEEEYDEDGNLINGKGEWKYTGRNTSNIKIILNKSDSLYSESNIAIELEKMGSYILNSNKHIIDGNEIPKRDNVKYKIYNNKELFARACREYNYINNFARCNGMKSALNNESMNGEAFPIFQANKQNYNKIKTVKFLGKSDFDKYPILEEYSELLTYLQEKIKDQSVDAKIRGKMRYLIKGVREDLDDVKNAMMRPIVFKSPLSSTSSSHCEDLVIPFNSEILPLLQYKYHDLIDTDLICCVLDIKEVVSKCKFTERQKEVLDLWVNDCNANDISKILKIAPSQVTQTLKSIAKIIEKKYTEQYEDWIGFNYKKSEWKTCNKCGESKLLKRFDRKSTNKDGYKGNCKNCN